jgi:molecular chaperone GrpE
MMEPGASANMPGEPESNNREIADIAALQKALEEEKAKAAENLAGWQRAQADHINFKRRVEQEREEICRSANAGLVCNILPVLDDMERAFISVPPELAADPWVNGIKLIERKLRSSLEAQGLCQIDALGEPFDPRYHDAVRQDKGKEGVVTAEVQKGYKFNDRVIRPSKVVVGSGDSGSVVDLDQEVTKEE